MKQDKNDRKNYNLKSDAVDALANADSQDTPSYSREELEKYRSRKGIRIPDLVKVILIKAWFAGAVCYFFFWGLGSYITNMLDMLFVIGVANGIVTDILVNNTIRFFEATPAGNDKWLMFPKKGMVSFFLNILYSFLIIYCVYTLYNLINLAIATATGNADTVPLGVEPILFGVFCMGFDMLFVLMKQLFLRIIEDAKASARPHSGERGDASD